MYLKSILYLQYTSSNNFSLKFLYFNNTDIYYLYIIYTYIFSLLHSCFGEVNISSDETFVHINACVMCRYLCCHFKIRSAMKIYA